MKLFTILLLFATQLTAQTITVKQAKKLSDEIVGCLKKNSIYSDSLNFKSIEQDFERYVDTFDTYQEVGYYYTRLLRKVGDNHSFYLSQNTVDNFSKKQKDSFGFSYKLLDAGIGYLSIPGFYSNDNNVVNDFANQIHNAIRELDSQGNIKGWVVDLRNNNGGNMWPMLLGLHPLIGDGVAGYFADNKGNTGWKTNSPSGYISIKDPYELKKPETKIAVLYSKKTISSGESTAVCFIGKPNSRSFGEPTGGYTTGNKVFPLSEGNIFVVASSYILDRNKKKYTGSITPDVVVEDPNDTNVLEQATAWLKQ